MLPGQQMMQPDAQNSTQTLDTHNSQTNIINQSDIPTVKEPAETKFVCCCCIPIRCGLVLMVIFEILECLISLNLFSQMVNFNWDEPMQLISGITMLILAFTIILFSLYISLKFILYLCKTCKAGSDSSLLRLHCREGMKAMLLKALVAFITRLILMFTLGEHIYRFGRLEPSMKYSDFPNTIGTIFLVNWWRMDIEKWVTAKIT